MVWRGSLRHRRRVVEQATRFIGMDVHKETIVVAATATGDVGKVTRMAHSPTLLRHCRSWLSACSKRVAGH
jgi:hypothetical protein